MLNHSLCTSFNSIKSKYFFYKKIITITQTERIGFHTFKNNKKKDLSKKHGFSQRLFKTTAK